MAEISLGNVRARYELLSVLDYNLAGLSDDATLLLVEYHGVPAMTGAGTL